MQILQAQIPKAQKVTDILTVFFVLLGSARIKAACKILVKLTTGVNFTHIEIQIETSSSQKVCATSIITSDQGG